MGRKISTKNSDGRSPQIEPGAATCSHDLQPLDLPNEPEFRPDAPPCDPDAFIRRCASMLPQILAQPLFWKERAERRLAEEREHNPAATYEQTFADITERDRRDTTRTDSPLVAADDAIVIDSTGMPIEDVFQGMMAIVRERSGR